MAFLNKSERLNIQPGARLKIIYDGTGYLATEKLQMCTSLVNLNYEYRYVNCTISSEPIVYKFCQYKNCSSADCYLHVTTLDEPPLEANYKISFENCTWPFHFNQINQHRLHSINETIYLYACELTIRGLCCSEKCLSNNKCTIGSNYTSTLLGYCLSNYNSYPVIGRCPLSRRYVVHTNKEYYYHHQVYAYYDYISTVLNDIVNNGTFTYMGRLNGACKTSSCVPINSPFLICANQSNTWEYGYVYHHDLLLFFTIEIIPLTLLVSVLIVLNVKLTNGSFNGYVFYCQVSSICFSLGYYFWKFENDNYYFHGRSDHHINILTIPLSIWNLNFLTFVPYICITPTMGSLGAIAFWYLIAAYPFLLLLFLYGWITMYNKGFRCVVSITRPIHHFLARFWRMTNIQPSFTHSISSIYVLCFTQFTATSLKLLHFTKWYSLINENETGIAFYYDGTLNYFGYPHAFLGILSIIILIVVVFIPTVYLLFHPFKWFHKMLDWCRLKRSQFVITLVDDYTGTFKNGCDNTNDYRYFAGFYLLLRFIIFFQFYIPIKGYHIIQGIKTSLYGIVAGSIMIFRPYRKIVHNFLEFLIFSIMAVNCGMTLSTDESSGYRLLLVMYLPPLVAFIYCIYWIIKKFVNCWFHCRPIKQKHTVTTEENKTNLNVNDTFADRVMNPDEYDEYHVSTVRSESSLVIEPLTTYYQEMTHHISINPILTTTTRSRHGGNNKCNNSNTNTLTRLLLDEESEL